MSTPVRTQIPRLRKSISGPSPTVNDDGSVSYGDERSDSPPPSDEVMGNYRPSNGTATPTILMKVRMYVSSTQTIKLLSRFGSFHDRILRN